MYKRQDTDIAAFTNSGGTDPSTYPFVKGEWIKPGALIIGVSCFDMDAEFMKAHTTLVVDNMQLYEAWAEEFPYPSFGANNIIGSKFTDMVHDGVITKDDIYDLGDIIYGKKPGRVSDDQIFIYSCLLYKSITFIYVTHDQEEALTMSDRIAIMNKGNLEQLSVPRDIYEHPATEFVADFIGESNIFYGVVDEKKASDVRISLENGLISAGCADVEKNEIVYVSVRPENTAISECPVDGFESVSYTHLDVYKRQIYTVENISEMRSQFLEQIRMLLDLDVYKRQKRNIARELAKRGCEVTIYPAYTSAEEIMAAHPDGVMLSNGPGDPKDCMPIVAERCV